MGIGLAIFPVRDYYRERKPLEYEVLHNFVFVNQEDKKFIALIKLRITNPSTENRQITRFFLVTTPRGVYKNSTEIHKHTRMKRIEDKIVISGLEKINELSFNNYIYRKDFKIIDGLPPNLRFKYFQPELNKLKNKIIVPNAIEEGGFAVVENGGVENFQVDMFYYILFKDNRHFYKWRIDHFYLIE